jgi:hypothetical protein
MKKLLIVSIVLIAAGLGLILYSDPVITLAGRGSGGTPQFISNNGGLPSVNSTSGSLPPGCKQVGGGVQCVTTQTGSGNAETSEIITLSGIALCGVGLCMTAVETISKTQSPFQTKTVT